MKLLWASVMYALTQGRQGEEESMMQSSKLWASDAVGDLDMEKHNVSLGALDMEENSIDGTPRFMGKPCRGDDCESRATCPRGQFVQTCSSDNTKGGDGLHVSADGRTCIS